MKRNLIDEVNLALENSALQQKGISRRGFL